MRIAAAGTAALFSLAVIAGAAEIGLHGFKFFVFRESGVGETSGNSTDTSFIAQQIAAAKAAAAKDAAQNAHTP